jgi:tetratricopeptide (TPR) repeat protein
MPQGTKKIRWLIAIFLLAAIVRAGYLIQIKDSPTFNNPIVDSSIYDRMADNFVKTGSLSDEFFWQPFFYPAFLSLVYSMSGSSVLCAKIIQALLGCITCVLTYHLGTKIFNQKIGIIAGIITSLYGPMIFFETELLASGWAAFWSIILILLFLKAHDSNKIWVFTLLGVCGALSVITRPTFLPFLLATSVWLIVNFLRKRVDRKGLVIRLLSMGVGFAIISAPITILSKKYTNEYRFLPISGGINLYLGNNPDYANTLTVRPGFGWREITTMPHQNGYRSATEKDKFFKLKVKDFIFNEPGLFMKGMIRKTIQYINSREIPRNTDIYLFGQWSGIFDVLTWKKFGFGFPFGLLLPLALWGIFSCRKQIPMPVHVFVLLFSLSIILVFVTGRYRIPIIPIASILAAAGLIDILKSFRNRQWRRIGIILVYIPSIVLASSMPGPFVEEKVNYEAELYFSLGDSLNKIDRKEDAVKAYSKAIQLRENYADAYYDLANILGELNKGLKAIEYFRLALETYPDNASIHNDLARQYFKLGKKHEAIDHYRKALLTAERPAQVHNDLGNVLAMTGQYNQAIEHYRESLSLRRNKDALTINNLANALMGTKQYDQAIDHYREFLKMTDPKASVYVNIGLCLSKKGQIDEAKKHFKHALTIDPNYQRAIEALQRFSKSPP